MKNRFFRNFSQINENLPVLLAGEGIFLALSEVIVALFVPKELKSTAALGILAGVLTAAAGSIMLALIIPQRSVQGRQQRCCRSFYTASHRSCGGRSSFVPAEKSEAVRGGSHRHAFGADRRVSCAGSGAFQKQKREK
jgi:hypothetical protein